jgi:SAM-dependent methyltransferase
VPLIESFCPFLEVWRSRCGLQISGLDVWVHGGGWTPFAPLINYLLTGNGGILTNSEGRVLERYLSRAVNGALATEIPEGMVPLERRRCVEALRWYDHASDAVKAVGGDIHSGVNPAAIPLPSNSIDLCHSGGALEHYQPEDLVQFLKECFRILRPGGIASHVFDHRDHLRHADRHWPFMAHLALPPPLYSVLCGHPLLYHNRLMPTQIMSLFEVAGFERILVRRMTLPEPRYVEDDAVLAAGPGLPRALLARRFQKISDADLRTAAAHYLYRKPSA